MNWKSIRYAVIPVLILLVWGLAGPLGALDQGGAIRAVSPREAAELLAENKDDPDFVVLDIRTPGEYQTGHLPKAILIDFYARDFADKLSKLDKQNRYLYYCRSGNRSRKSLALFQKLQFQQVYHLAHGIKSWQKAGLPLEK